MKTTKHYQHSEDVVPDPSGDDIVDLVFVTANNFLYVSNITRQRASDMIRGWWDNRELLLKDALGTLPPHPDGLAAANAAIKRAEEFMSKGTFALNCSAKDDESQNWANWAIGWEHVLGMYIKERTLTIADQMNELQLKMMKKSVKDLEKGDEWKGDE